MQRISAASYPDVPLSMNMCAQRKAGRRKWASPCRLYPSHGPLRRFISRSPLPCDKRRAWGGGWYIRIRIISRRFVHTPGLKTVGAWIKKILFSLFDLSPERYQDILKNCMMHWQIWMRTYHQISLSGPWSATYDLASHAGVFRGAWKTSSPKNACVGGYTYDLGWIKPRK